MPKQSAGILVHRTHDGGIQVLLVHPGGPFFAKKDAGVWTIPKGEIEAGEDPLACARREFAEEIGVPVEGPFVSIGSVKQKGGKVVHAFAVAADLDLSNFRSNTFEMMWPPRSGKMATFPEVDEAAYFSIEDARSKINPAQVELIDTLIGNLR